MLIAICATIGFCAHRASSRSIAAAEITSSCWLNTPESHARSMSTLVRVARTMFKSTFSEDTPKAGAPEPKAMAWSRKDSDWIKNVCGTALDSIDGDEFGVDIRSAPKKDAESAKCQQLRPFFWQHK